jgi:type II secretory ATPase GspE/PulE/Tfp pilus assembly ATPase PilB-like protein
MDTNNALSDVAIASGRGSKYEVPVMDVNKLCLMTDGNLYVASAYTKDIAVLAYIELLRRNGVTFKIQLTTVDEIQRKYSTNAVATSSDNSIRQEQVIALIQRAVQRGASDIHFRNFMKHTEIWTRIDGFLDLDKQNVLSPEDGAALCGTMYRSMCDVAEGDYIPNKSQDGRLSRAYLSVCGLVGARIATRPLDYGNEVVLRLLARKKKQTMHELGYLNQQQKQMLRMTERTHGINIFSGETGSGKSTSLEILLSELVKINKQTIKLITIEDPPEYVIPGAIQTPIICDRSDAEAVSREWAHSISNVLRLDPDVIMVGEMRDKDSAVAAFRAAMTGHGVWTTLHANDAIQILERLRDIGVDINLLTDASTVTGLINQSLAPKNCEHCRRPYLKYQHEINEELHNRIETYCEPDKVFLKGNDKGCPHCKGKGYKGRTVIAETIIPTQSMMNVFKREGKAAARKYWVEHQKGITKAQHLIQKINQGIIDPQFGEQMVCSLDEDVITLS